MIVIDDTSNMVEVAKYFSEFCMDESCGKCIPCRVGTKHIYMMLDKIVKGEATENDFELLKELCVMVKETSLCGLGQSAPNGVLSTVRFFNDEYISKLKKSNKDNTPSLKDSSVIVAKET
jgi:bidirectional [NiFe] hydrogenase diaphorase subunit